MPQQTGVATIVGTYQAGGSAPTIAYDELAIGSPTTWAVVAVNASLTNTGAPEPQRDGNGKVNGFIFPENIKKLELTAKVKATSHALALAAMVAPSPGAKITLANFVGAGNVFNADYICEESKLELTDSETEPARITLTATKYETAADTLLSTIS